MTKPTCFIIQPFDKAEFDELYDDVIEIAVDKCNAICLRSDKILGAKPPLDKIKESIEAASVCIAEVTLDNPNVFFEAGWAFSLNVPTFVLWDEFKRPKGLPFDIHGKAGIPYNSKNNGWRKELRDKLMQNIEFELKNNTRTTVKRPVLNNDNQELNEIDKTILGILLKSKSKHQEIGVIAMNYLVIDCGFVDTKITLSLQKLLRLKLIGRTHNTHGDNVCHYYLLDKGIQEIEKNIDEIEPILKKLPSDFANYAPRSIAGWY